MAYSTSAPPQMVSGPLTGARKRWMHTSVDASAAVDASGFITNGGALGMEVGDIVEHYDTTNTITSTHLVISVSTTYPGAVDLGDGTVIGLATNSD